MIEFGVRIPVCVGPVQSSGMITIIGHILKTEHVSGLWKGMTPSIARCVPGVGLYFSSLHTLKSHFVPPGGEPGPLQAMTMGVAARTMSGVCLIPITVIKTRFESGVYQYKGMGEALRVIYRTEGARGLCCGLVPTLFRDAPFSGLYLMFYTQIKTLLPEGEDKLLRLSGVYQYKGMGEALRVIYRTEGARGLCCGLVPTLFRDAPFSGLYLMFYTQIKTLLPEGEDKLLRLWRVFADWLKGNLSAPTNFSCGLVAGLLASVMTQPADVLKTKMQLYPDKFQNLQTIIVYVHKKYGVKGYFKGLVPRMLRRTLMAAMAWTVYEQVRQLSHEASG
uniref:Mitochondrial glycine transporter n=1 Tax=Timema shepardi TaxID=629360 RepID=A0A7R9ATT3_TIMSH|nr:unnamed protein product [Timema shepardi]